MVTIVKKISISLISSLIILAPVGNVYARDGLAARQLAEIDSHISDKDYNQALEMLTAFIRDYPDQFDEAQKRIDQVIAARNNLTDLADQLIYVIENDPENDELKLELIEQINNVEINPSAQMKSFLESTRRASEFAVNRIKFQNIITEGASLSHEARYTDAVLSQIKGFTVYYDAFIRDTDEAMVSAVNDELNFVRQQVERFGDISDRAERAFAQLETCLTSDDLSGTRRALKTVQDTMAEYAALRNAIAGTGYHFQELFAEMAAEQGLETEASYLPFAWRFILGTASEEDSGMVGAMDLLWNSLVENAKLQALSAVQVHVDATIPLTAAGETAQIVKNTTAIEKELNSLRSYLETAGTLEGLNGQLLSGEGVYATAADDAFALAVSDLSTVCTWMQGLLINDDTYRQALAVMQKTPLESVAEHAGTDIATGDFTWITSMTEQYRKLQSLYEGAVEYSGAIMDIAARAKDVENGKTPSLAPLHTETYLSQVLTMGLQLQSETRDTLTQLLDSLQQYTNLAADGVAASRTALYNDCYALLNEELNPEISSYPQNVIPQTAVLLPDFAASSQNLSVLAQKVSGICDTAAITSAQGTVALLTEQTTALRTKAEDRVLQANRIYAEGELRYSEAKKAISKDDYSSARNSIQKAGSRYAESFLYREDAALRAACDAKLIALGEEINRLENERIVLEVRRLKKEAKSEYYAGNFESADSLLQQARARWLITNVEDDPEIVQLQALVGTALSMKTGRTLSPSAPLYPEMSQTLNIAHSFFNEGETLLKQGKREEGVAALEKAQQKIRELQLVYPLNQEASLMSLQIDKLIDPAAFEVYFAQKIATAKQEYKDADKQRQVYADLLDLYEINPSYKGLKDFIYTVEIELGVRQKPIDRTAQNQSDALYKEAVALYNKNSRDEITLRSALTKVDEALAKNPDNESAQTLKDRINIALGGSGSVVLPSEAESMYQKAVQELQKGNTIQAAAIVMQLMQNPDYAKSAKILDLKKKVDSLL